MNMEDVSGSEGLWRVAEAAGFLKVSPRFVAQEVRKGRLPAVRLSRKIIRLRPQDVAAYAEGRVSRSVD